jgi:hypothetical protein
MRACAARRNSRWMEAGMSEPRLLLDAKADLGEGPLW